MHAEDPANGVRYELFLVSGDAERATYRVDVHVADGSREALVEIDRAGARLIRCDDQIEAAQRAQLVALARTLGKRDEAPWPRRVNRWRSPGVR